MTLAGIDVSEYQGEIDWQAVADSGITFAILKGTEGVESRDPYFQRNWDGARSVGIIRSAYHFFIASKDPIVQANNFLRLTEKVWTDTDLPPVLDLEKTYFLNPGSVIARATIWLNTIEKALGRKPIVYTFPNFWENTLGNPAAFSNYPLWIAHYETNNPIVPGGWKTWTFHQYTEEGVVPGVEGPCDRNHFQGDTDDLQKLLKAKAPLKVGARGQVVLEVQNRLKAKGFDLGTPDGSFGKRTKAAVITLQKSYQLNADGIVGPRTWMVLQTLKASDPVINPPPSTAIQLIDVCRSYRQKPHQDEALTWLQQQLPPPILAQFTQTWRQVTDSSPMNPTPLTLINVCKSYKTLSHQDTALNRLQQQISPSTLSEFARRWRLK
jgi:lysozyme